MNCNAGEFETCKGQNEALRCNSAGNDYELTQCERGCVNESGGCVECIDNTQCANPTPHCNASSQMCERCRLDEDCTSQVCDDSRGECLAPSTIVYIAPTGSAIGNCGTQSTPCSLERGIARLDATLRILKVAPGMYAPAQALTIGGFATVYGHGATIRGSIAISDPAQVHLRGLVVEDGGLRCDKTAGQPLLDLDRVTVKGSTRVSVFGCIVTVRRSRFESQDFPIFQIADPATSVTVDRTWFESPTSAPGRGIYAAGGIEVTNSVFVNIPEPINHVTGAQDDSKISFSTFINSPIMCLGGLSTDYTNNVMFSSAGDVIANPERPCRYSYNVMSAQLTVPMNGFMNTVGDPRLVDVPTADFHLRPESPAVDSANPFPDVSLDFEGTSRPQGAQRDVGAFEYKP
ncbi:MAG: hypothetical protein H0T42_19805 [Deltaproteobacteria bacterium]|nr:hypothetical protein [Deltaproteobacteria bacterium]